MKACVTTDKSRKVAEIIERIPRSDDDALPIYQLCPEAQKGNHSCVNCVLSILTLLKVVDAVQVLEGGDLPRVKASSQTAQYFLRSLAQFVKHGITLTTNWEREGVSGNVSPVQAITSGA